MSPLLFFHFNHRHTHWDLSAYSLNESCRADVFISRVSSVPSQLHRRLDECKSMPIDYPFSLHKNCLPQSPIHPLYSLSLRMDSSTPIVLCGNAMVAHWVRLCTLAILWVKKNWSLHLRALFISNFHPTSQYRNGFKSLWCSFTLNFNQVLEMSVLFAQISL